MRNIKVMTDKEIQNFEKLYDFEIDDHFVYIYPTGVNRKTVKDRIKSWTLLITKYHRRITFNVYAMNLYAELKDRYSLFAVQNAVNILTLSFQPINKQNVINVIECNFNEVKINEEN